MQTSLHYFFSKIRKFEIQEKYYDIYHNIKRIRRNHKEREKRRKEKKTSKRGSIPKFEKDGRATVKKFAETRTNSP